MILTTVYKKPQGILLKLDPGKPGNLSEFCAGNWVDTLDTVISTSTVALSVSVTSFALTTACQHSSASSVTFFLLPWVSLVVSERTDY